MNNEVPQIHSNPDHSWYHPQELLISAINGIARFEHWSRQTPDTTELDQRIQRIRQERVTYVEQRRRIGDLTLQATVDPDTYQEPLLEARREYHFERARVLGSRAIGLESKTSIVSKGRLKLIEIRQAHHRAKGQKAASAILRLGADFNN